MSLKRKLSRFAVYTAEDEAEERRLGVSTKLKLYTDPFDIKKELTTSDVNGLSRLMLPSETVHEHILSLWDEERIARAKTAEGVRVSVVDIETQTEHQLTFKRWQSSNTLVLTSNWMASFVCRRNLKQGDTIALLWSRSSSKFYFRVVPQPYRAQS